MSFLPLPVLAATYTINQASGSIGVEGTAYTDNMEEIWYINIGSASPVQLSFYIDTEEACDDIDVYSINASGVETLIHSLSGQDYGTISSVIASGKVKIVFMTDGSVSNGSGYKGFSMSFSAYNYFSVNESSYTTCNSIVNGKMGIGTSTPRTKLHINNGNNTDAAILASAGEGNNLVVSSLATSPVYTTVFKISHEFNNSDRRNGYMAFHRGCSTYGGFLEFGTNGLPRMTIDKDGLVGVGTSSPTQALTVTGNLSISPSGTTRDEKYNGSLIITKPSSASGQYINLIQAGIIPWSIGTVYNAGSFAIGISKITDSEFRNPFFVITPEGKVGINDSIPRARLHINNGNNSDAAILATTTAGNNLVVSSLNPDTQWGTVFKISHEFYNFDRRNGYIAFHRGGDTYGGFLDFGTNGLSRVTINQDGKVGIGTSNPSYLLDVKGTIRATEVRVVSVDNFADFVFDKNYELPKLANVGDYIQTNGHLPNIPSAKEVKENGVDLAEMQVKLLQKVEELTLYALDQQKRIEKQQERIDKLEKELKEVKNK
ncbi:MAG: hypothetical protein Q8914_03055 [Bacteroidota bacterium]|nr:hypothetical protein [Bacteroidota bacterium]